MWWYEGLKETSIDRKGENGRERERERERESGWSWWGEAGAEHTEPGGHTEKFGL